MLQLYIYNRMKKKNLHDVAEIFAQEANLEISQLAECDESLLTEWWESFWPTFCSRMSNKGGANAQSSGQPSMGNALAMIASLKNQGASSSRQTPMSNPQQDVLPVIPPTRMSQQLAGNTPIIPNFNNAMQGNQASNLLPPLEMNQQIVGGLNNCGNVIAQSPAELLSARGINQRRTGKLPMNTVSDSIMGQSAAENLLVAERNQRLRFSPIELHPSQTLFDANNMLYTLPPSGSQSHLQLPATVETPAQITKDPKNVGLGRSDQIEPTRPVGPNSGYTIIEHHAGLSAAQALGKGPLGFPPVQLLPTEITPVPPPVNPSHLKMPVTIQPSLQVARALRNDVSVERSVQVGSTYSAGQGSTYPPAAPNAGEANWKSQMPPTGVRMGVPGPDLVSYKSRVPALFLQLMHQTVQAHKLAANPPPDKYFEEVQEAGETSGTRRDLENVPNSEDPNAVEEGNGTKGENIEVEDDKHGTGSEELLISWQQASAIQLEETGATDSMIRTMLIDYREDG